RSRSQAPPRRKAAGRSRAPGGACAVGGGQGLCPPHPGTARSRHLQLRRDRPAQSARCAQPAGRHRTGGGGVMANAFERHGLDHLSASSINLFVAQPAMWAMQKLMGRKSMAGPAAHRGTAIEAGVEMGLFDPAAPVEACQEAALARFNQLTALSADPAVEKERANIAPAVAIALAELRQYGVPAAADETRQHRIEVQLPGVPVPFIGWLDFWFPEHGIIVDLKTQAR